MESTTNGYLYVLIYFKKSSNYFIIKFTPVAQDINFQLHQIFTFDWVFNQVIEFTQ